jgi:predicted metal-dependent hydrolase
MSLARMLSSLMQLSLFDEAPAPAAPGQPSPLRPQTPPPMAAGTAPAAPAGSEFRHPRSQRDIVLGEHRVAYELREKTAWILRKLHEQRERARRLDSAKVDWREGTAIPFLGESVILVLDNRTTGAVLHTADQTLPGVPRLTLHLGLPQSASSTQIRDAVQSWLQRQARRIFEERCQVFTSRLGVRMTRLSLSSASTRWGSASADGSIRLNWRLVHFALPVIDYVVTHELAHLREMNHSPAFWDVVRTALPDFEQARVTLKDEVLPVFD